MVGAEGWRASLFHRKSPAPTLTLPRMRGREWEGALSTGSERDVVVEIVDGCAGAGRHGGTGGMRLIAKAAAGIALVITAFHPPPAGAAGAVEHPQLAPGALPHDLGRVTLLTPLVRPFSGRQSALE